MRRGGIGISFHVLDVNNVIVEVDCIRDFAGNAPVRHALSYSYS